MIKHNIYTATFVYKMKKGDACRAIVCIYPLKPYLSYDFIQKHYSAIVLGFNR